MPHEALIEKCRNLCYNRDRSEKWKMIRRGAQAAFYRCDFPKRRSPRRTRSRGDLPRDFPFGERVSAAKSAGKTDDFPKRLLSPDGTRAGDDRVPTHRMLRAALKLEHILLNRLCLDVPTHRMLRAAWDNKQNSTVYEKHSAIFVYILLLHDIVRRFLYR